MSDNGHRIDPKGAEITEGRVLGAERIGDKLRDVRDLTNITARGYGLAKDARVQVGLFYNRQHLRSVAKRVQFLHLSPDDAEALANALQQAASEAREDVARQHEEWVKAQQAEVFTRLDGELGSEYQKRDREDRERRHAKRAEGPRPKKGPSRKAYDALLKAGVPVFYHEGEGPEFSISAEEPCTNGDMAADYYQEYLRERQEPDGKIVNAFGIQQLVHDVLEKHELFAEWKNPGCLGVYKV